MVGRYISLVLLIVSVLVSCSTNQVDTTFSDNSSSGYENKKATTNRDEKKQNPVTLTQVITKGKVPVTVKAKEDSENGIGNYEYEFLIFGNRVYGEVSEMALSCFSDAFFNLTEEEISSFLDDVSKKYVEFSTLSSSVYKSGFFLLYSSYVDVESILVTLADNLYDLASSFLMVETILESEEVEEESETITPVEEVVIEDKETTAPVTEPSVEIHSEEVITDLVSLEEDKTSVEEEVVPLDTNPPLEIKSEEVVSEPELKEDGKVTEEALGDVVESKEEENTVIEKVPLTEDKTSMEEENIEIEETEEESPISFEEEEEVSFLSRYITDEIRECLERIIASVFSYGM